ncbi:dGTP triphosphohydrolase [uncultured Aquimarina sp.]|uniref:deoxyguanosinetriphosphate triphosphohydrolase family protein n=1 Tax=uncultured Aquimarina sp. TaxID=575652 RepID=UPI002635FF0F|nr:dNTP triphosphohydrolase [uncultured Aquimarina sp.]
MEEKYKQILNEKVDGLINSGVTDFHEILKNCESADPRLIEEIYNSKRPEEVNHKVGSALINYQIVGNNHLPAPDVNLSQWWFEESTIKYLINKIQAKAQFSPETRILNIGTPTLAIKTSENYETTLLDLDIDVISAFNRLKRQKCTGIEFNIADDLPKRFHGAYDMVLVDPPWYNLAIKTALNRAIQGAKLDGEILFSFPGRLTRPGIDEFRSELIKEIVSIGHDIVSIEHDNLLYVVPFFEKNALKDLKNFSSIAWRKGDLIVIKKKSEKVLKIEGEFNKIDYQSFARNPKEFRVFLKDNSSLSDGLPPKKIENYSKNISTRAFREEPDLWTTAKIGLQISDHVLMEKILSLWKTGSSIDKVKSELIGGEYAADRINLTVDTLEEMCGLWGNFSSPDVLRTPTEIIESKQNELSNFAIRTNTRIIEESSDEFRPPFSRDRDRLIWSSGFKKLADKTQLFPSVENDSVRRRLTHTLEVQQLALTIGTSLGLNLDLIEASALAHDIGHTPFGHAGEHAINNVLSEIHTSLNGFNHYEHALDVLNFLESPYANDPYQKFLGLNISTEVLEAALKHTYYHSDNEFSSNKLLERSKHKENIPKGYCHLEGQAVRIADKISYLISDLEDGIRIGAIDIFDLIKCHLFHISPLYFDINSSENTLSQYLRQRKSLIKLLMEDVINSSTLKISQKSIKSPQDSREADEYIIDHSIDFSSAVDEVWNSIQVDKLFSNRKVLNANLLAAKIVSELVILFTIIPQLIEEDFLKEYKTLKDSRYFDFYKDKLGNHITIKAEMLNFMPFHLLIGTNYPAYQDIKNVPLIDLLRSKDYVASLTDYKARKVHNELLNNEIK